MSRVRIPSSIASDLSVDVTADLQSFLNDTPDNTTIVCPWGGQYRVDGTLELIERNDLVLFAEGPIADTPYGAGAGVCEFRAVTDGSEAANPLHRKMWRCILGSNLAFWNVAVRGGNPNAGTANNAYDITKESQHLFEFRGTQGVLLDRVTGTDPYGDFLYVGHSQAPGFIPTRNLTCRRFDFQRNGRQGVSVTTGTNVHVYGGNIAHCRRAVFDMEPNDELGDGLQNIHFEHNLVGPHRLNFVSNVGAGDAPHDGVYVRWNILSGQSGPDFAVARMAVAVQANLGAPGQYRKRYRICHNRTTNQIGSPAGYAMFIEGVEDLVVEGNVQPLEVRSPNQHLVNIHNCVGVRVRGNQLPNAYAALRLDGGGGNSDYCQECNRVGTNADLADSLLSCG